MTASHMVDVTGTELRTSERVVSATVKQHGQRKVTRIVTEITEEPYVLLSCGCYKRKIDFDYYHGKGRKRVVCDHSTVDERI